MLEPRIVLLGATGYTGRLTATALAQRDLHPTLAGRDVAAVSALAAELGDLPVAYADVSDPASIRALVSQGDVLVSTVGPFTRWGAAAVEAALAAGAHYVDSTGEPAFVRRVFERYDSPARDAGIAMLPAFGYDYVPGNLAAGLALADAGAEATSVTVGYFTTGPLRISRGTLLSGTLAMLEPGYTWRGGTLVTEAPGLRALRHPTGNAASRRSLSFSGSEQLSLPRIHPQLRDVHVGIGWLGSATPAAAVASRATAGLLRLPGARDLGRTAVNRILRSPGTGPGAEHNAAAGITITAHAHDSGGNELARVQLDGPSIYPFTAQALAWCAERLATEPTRTTGALGPLEAFGLAELEAGCAAIGLCRVTA